MLLSVKDATMLWTMLSSLSAVQDGKTTIKEVEKDLGNVLKNKYINPIENNKK